MNAATRRRLVLLAGLLVCSLALYVAAELDAPLAEGALLATLSVLAVASVKWG